MLSLLSLTSSRTGFEFRDPQRELDNVYRWRALRTREERKQLFAATGNRFTALHRIPGWHTSTASPPDAMHLLYLGAMNWIVKQVLVGPGILNKRHPGDRDPQDIFNECLNTMWMPKNFQRLPPKVSITYISPAQMGVCVLWRIHLCSSKCAQVLRSCLFSLDKHEGLLKQTNGSLHRGYYTSLSF